MGGMEPGTGVEPATLSLQMRCTAIVLSWPKFSYIIPNPSLGCQCGIGLEVPQGCNGRFMQGCSKVPASAHSAYIVVYVFAPASTERCNPLQAIRSLPGHPTGGPSPRDGHSHLSRRIKRIGSAREKRMENDFLVNCSTPFLVASRSDATPCQDSWSREAQNMTT